MKLQSMTDFVLHESFGVGNEIINNDVFYNKVSRYAKFLKKLLNLGMFVPCDLDGNVLNEPENYSHYILDNYEFDKLKIVYCNEWFIACEQYQQAKERVLFKGYYVNHNAIMSPCGGYLDESKLKYLETIESLIGTNIELTESVIRQIGL